jgi:two-component system, OmpR family, phosphate regulon response regulator OmpR
MSLPRVLIVDDDRELSAMLRTYLEAAGFAVELHGSGVGVDEAIRRADPEVLILDVMLPGEDGLSIARRLSGSLPILMLSARGEDVDRILGLEFGADDYLPKPFNPRELLARVKALLRRPRSAEGAPLIHFGPFTLDLDRRVLTREGEPILLTSGEYMLLRVLASRPGRVFSREELSAAVSGPEQLPYDRSIDARVSRLRRRLGEDADEPQFIRTVWGAGYVFTGREP